MAQILVLDTTLRAGEQSPGVSFTPAEKLRMAHELEELGVDIIEAGFPVASMGDFTAVRGVAEEVRQVTIAAMARARFEDIDRAAAALDGAKKARIHTFLGTSDIHLEHKHKISRDECLVRAGEAVRRARQYADEVQFTAVDASRTDPDFLAQVMTVVVEAGANTVNIADTVGFAHPEEFRERLGALLLAAPTLKEVVVSVQCHNDLGLAVANTLAGIQGGARQVECTINGVGERAGNAALEEVVMALAVRPEVTGHGTGVKTRNLQRASRLLSHISGIHPQANKAIVGGNAFQHGAGIHQDGVIKNPSTYQIMNPEEVGAPESSLVLGKHSGRNALSQRFADLGYAPDEEALDRAYRLFSVLAEQKSAILDEDLLAILHFGAMEDVPVRHRLSGLTVQCGENRSTARVEISLPDGEVHRGEGEGDGPIAAAFTAVDAATGKTAQLIELTIRASTEGRDAVGEVNLVTKVGGKTFSGRGASTDVVNAATRAYLHTLDKAEQAETLETIVVEGGSLPWEGEMTSEWLGLSETSPALHRGESK
jgi:2-isopropylmalate synthase